MIQQYVVYLVLKTASVAGVGPRWVLLRLEVLDEALERGEDLTARILLKCRGWGNVGRFNEDVGPNDGTAWVV